MTYAYPCPSCGGYLVAGMAFCPSCGKALDREPVPPIPNAAYPAPPPPTAAWGTPPAPGYPPPYPAPPYFAPQYPFAPPMQPSPWDTSAIRPSGVNKSAVGLLIGGILVAVGCFLPWITMSFMGMSISVSGMDKDADGLLVLILGAILAIVGIARLSRVRLGGARALGLGVGALAVGLAILEAIWLRADLGGIGSDYMAVDLGVGLLVIGIGGAVAAFAALLADR